MEGLGEYLAQTSDLSGLGGGGLSAAIGSAPDGIGAVARPARGPAGHQAHRQLENAVPILRDVRRLSGRGASGMGQLDEGTVTAGVIALVVLGLTVRAGAGYLAGKAMAPRGHETAYAWTGAGVGLVFGMLGVGVQAIVALNSRGSHG